MLLVTAEEMRALDRRTIAGGHATGEALMERAGAGVVEAIERRFGAVLALRMLVLCGTGNNGGDGFVAARHLRARGADVHVGLLGARDRVAGDAKLHLERLEAAGVQPAEAPTEAALEALVRRRDAWDFGVDAMLGTGARGGPRGVLAAGVRGLARLREAGARVVAVDLPSGVDADTGAPAADAVSADLTVTFGAPKRGLVLFPGRAHAGAIEVVDIGLVDPAPEDRAQAVELATAADVAPLLGRRDPRAHKSSVGRVLAVGGSPGLTGAVVLAARAATRAGAGYVQAAIPGATNLVLEILLVEEMSIALGDTHRAALAPEDWDALADVVARADVLAIGSGMSRAAGPAALARRIVRECPHPLVIDADALNAFEGRAAELAQGRAPRVVTPHVGEMARLTGLQGTEIEKRRIDVAREFARAWDAVVVLKGAPTVIAAPSGRVTVNSTGNPGMATAGMGDVLTGTLAAFAARVGSLEDAARLAVYLHGLAGDLVADSRGPVGMRAGDVAEKLPEAIRLLAGLAAEVTPRA